jgi:Cu(I)/Ag(I) efflux system membrane protein CusA/SilA
MLVYLDAAYERRIGEGRMRTAQDLREAVMEVRSSGLGPS